MATRIEPTPLSNSFFSDFNRESLHLAIIEEARKRTGYVIDRQNDGDLQAYMKSVYVNMMRDPFQNVRGQLDAMNRAVVTQAMRDVIPGVLQQLIYLRDASSLPTPLLDAQSTSTRGMKFGESNKWGF
jgi:hypothetical protein